MAGGSKVRTREDLERAIRAIAREFETDTVFIIGSQAILMSWPEAPINLRMSPEIDAYPDNAALWEQRESWSGEPPAEASEHINALFGEGSMFHLTHGFYIDGVDQWTATLPKAWRACATVRRFDVGGRLSKQLLLRQMI